MQLPGGKRVKNLTKLDFLFTGEKEMTLEEYIEDLAEDIFFGVYEETKEKLIEKLTKLSDISKAELRDDMELFLGEKDKELLKYLRSLK